MLNAKSNRYGATAMGGRDAEEVKKVNGKLPKWARQKKQKQINARILNAFLALKQRGMQVVTPAEIHAEYRKHLRNGESDIFEKNFDQMKNFGKKNHGKVFQQEGNQVCIWSPVVDAVRKYECGVMPQSKTSAIGVVNDTAESEWHRRRDLDTAISEAEWQVRRDLVACYRLFVRFGWTDLIFTHLTARVPGQPQQYLINPYGLLFQEITAANLLKVDFDGNVIAGDYPYNDAGHAIHTAILKVRPDVNVVLHSHTRAGMAVSCMQSGLLPITQQANEVMELVCYHDYDVVTENAEECRRLGQDLGDKWLMIMRNHGLLSAGRNVAEAFYLLYMLENACKVQVDVMACRTELVTPAAPALATMAEYGRPPVDAPSKFVTMSWKALLRSLQ